MDPGIGVRAPVCIKDFNPVKGAALGKIGVRGAVEDDGDAGCFDPGKLGQTLDQFPTGSCLVSMPSRGLTHYIVAIDDVSHNTSPAILNSPYKPILDPLLID